MSRKGYDFPSSVKEEARRRVRYRCERCGEQVHTEAHHKIPIWFAKEIPWLSPAIISSLQNVEILCPSCHDLADQETQHMTREELTSLAQSILGVAQTFMALLFI